MINKKRIVVVMPAYEASATLERTYNELVASAVDDVILVDDGSFDNTVAIARSLGINCFRHDENRGYGANQKTCYLKAMAAGADVVVMVHPDYQYDPRLVTAMAAPIAFGVYDVMLGSRILGNTAVKSGMPRYKYVSNRVLTAFQNILLREKLSEYHTGYRAFSRKVLETLPLRANTDDFAFDNEMLAQVFIFGFRVGELSCPTRYLSDSSSIGFLRAVTYGLAVLRISVQFRLRRMGLAEPRFLVDDPLLRLETGRQTATTGR